MKEHHYLNNKILLQNDEGEFKRLFLIVGRFFEDEGSVYYEALCGEKRASGILVEYCTEGLSGSGREQDRLQMPQECANQGDGGAAQSGEGRLQMPQECGEEGGLPAHFRKMRDRLEQSRELREFIPKFEIFHSCDEKKNESGTVYVWMPMPGFETFGTMCEGIHKDPGTKPEHKLVAAMAAIEALARGVMALHDAGLSHANIQPFTIAFLRQGYEGRVRNPGEGGGGRKRQEPSEGHSPEPI